MRKAFVGGLLLCLMTTFAVPVARAQDGSVVATGELYVRRTIFCRDGQDFDPADPSACDDTRATVLADVIEIEFPLDGSGDVTGSWELVVEYAEPDGFGFCRHQSGGSLRGTYDPVTRAITGEQLEEGSLRTWNAEDGECTDEREDMPPLGAWEASFDGSAVSGVLGIDDSGGRQEVGGITFHAPAEVTGDIGELEDGDAGPNPFDVELDEDFEPQYYDYDDDEGGGVPLAALAGGAAVLGLGGVGAARLARARRRRTPLRELTEDDRPPVDPCAEQRGRAMAASARSKGLQRGLETLRTLDRQLEDAWNNGREAGFWSSYVDVASFGLGGVPDAVLTTVGGGVITTIVKTLGESAAKDFLGWAATDMAANPAAWPSGVPEDVGKAVAMNRLRQYAFGHFIDGLSAGDVGSGILDPDLVHRVSSTTSNIAQGAFREAVLQPIEMAVESAGMLMKLYGGTMESVDKLEEIRGQQLRVTSHINNLENQLADAMNQLDLARHALALCEKPAGAAAP